jgi:polar amino acid transport system permease protein
MVMFVKDTALASQAGVFELMFAGKALVNRGLDPFLVFATVLFAYFAISWPLARFGQWLETRLAHRHTKGGIR